MKRRGRLRCKVIDILKLMRPQSVGLMLLFVLLPIFVRTKDLMYAVMQVVPLFMLLTGEIILNDLKDVEKDKINKPHRPLAAGKISASEAKVMIGIFLIMAVVSGFGIYKTSLYRMIIFYTVFVMLTLYSLLLKYFASIKWVVTATVTVLCLCFIFTFWGIELQLLLFMGAAFFYIAGREILMDIRDYEGDKKCQCRTLAVIWGTQQAYCLAVVLIVLSQVIYVGMVCLEDNPVDEILCLLSIIVVSILLFVFKRSKRERQNKVAILLWLPMLLALPSIM